MTERKFQYNGNEYIFFTNHEYAGYRFITEKVVEIVDLDTDESLIIGVGFLHEIPRKEAV